MLISFGVTLHECLKAQNSLKAEGINCRVLDLISLKPLDVDGIQKAIEACNGNALIVEEHYPEGGACDAVCSAAVGLIKKLGHLCVRKVPGSAKPAEQLELQGLDSSSIAAKIRLQLS